MQGQMCCASCCVTSCSRGGRLVCLKMIFVGEKGRSRSSNAFVTALYGTVRGDSRGCTEVQSITNLLKSSPESRT